MDTSSSWSQGIHESSQNAISTLLQPPIVRTGLLPHTAAPASSAHKPPTARDIPPVTLTTIERVDPAEFKPYLTQVGALYEQLRRVKESDDDGADQIFRRDSKSEPFPELDEAHLRPGGNRGRPSSSRKTSVSSLGATSPAEGPQTRRRSSSNFGRRAAQGPPPLNTIPAVYFDEDFHLENPRTFDVVSERSEVVRPAPGSAEEKNAANGSAPAPRKALATNAILQEKLSWYMDTIEMHLIASISTASTTFFTALGSLRELHSEAAVSVERIKTLRQELETLDQEMATSGLEIVQKRRKMENLRQLNDAVQQLRYIAEGLAECESLVDAGEIDKALKKTEVVEKLLAGRGPWPGPESGRFMRDMRDAVALQGVNGDIASLRYRIGKEYESRFVDVLIGDLRQHVETVSPQEVLLRWSSAAMRSRGALSREPSAFPAYLSSTETLRSQLMPIVTGLDQAKHITMAIGAYRETVLREIRKLVQRPLPSSDDDDNVTITSASTRSGRKLSQQEKSSILARNLRALDPVDAEALFTKIYIGITETLRRLSTQVKVLFDVASSMGQEPDLYAGLRSPLKSPNPLKSPPLNSGNQELQEDIHLTMDMANLMGQAVDLAQEKIVKVLRVRSEQSSHLPLELFLRYFTLNLYFANECESISGRSGSALKTVVNSHIKEFIDHHGDAEKQKLAQGMESDQWAARDFNEENKRLLDKIVESSTQDAAVWTEGSKIWVPYAEAQTKTNGRPRAESNGAAKEKNRSAVVDSESFILPPSAILCLDGMACFMQLIAGIPSMASDVTASLIAYLQLFNSRCTQLILGAGATRSAGLKNITTRHLALAAQALSFISTLIPYVREFVRRIAGTGANVNHGVLASLMGEFDKVKRLYQEHQNSIYDKLVEIMSGRAAAHTKTMKGLDWDRPPAGEGEATVDVFMETLVKETVTLHRVLSKHLPEGTVLYIMKQIFESYKVQFGKALQGMEVQQDHGIKRMEEDMGYLHSRLSKMGGFDDTAEYLLNIVKGKRPDKPPPVPAKNGTDATPNGEADTKAEEKSTETDSAK